MTDWTTDWRQGAPAIIPVCKLVTSYRFRSGKFTISMNIVGVPYSEVHLIVIKKESVSIHRQIPIDNLK